jgi:hypothetical protein
MLRLMHMRRLLMLLAVLMTAAACATGGAAKSPASAGPLRPCLVDDDMERSDSYVGMSEAEARRTAAHVRVVRRDGECLGTSRDLRPGRVNLVVVDMKVTYAATEVAP